MCSLLRPAEIEQYYGDSKYDRVSLLCASASFYTRKVSLLTHIETRSPERVRCAGPPREGQETQRRVL